MTFYLNSIPSNFPDAQGPPKSMPGNVTHGGSSGSMTDATKRAPPPTFNPEIPFMDMGGVKIPVPKVTPKRE